MALSRRRRHRRRRPVVILRRLLLAPDRRRLRTRVRARWRPYHQRPWSTSNLSPSSGKRRRPTCFLRQRRGWRPPCASRSRLARFPCCGRATVTPHRCLGAGRSASPSPTIPSPRAMVSATIRPRLLSTFQRSEGSWAAGSLTDGAVGLQVTGRASRRCWSTASSSRTSSRGRSAMPGPSHRSSASRAFVQSEVTGSRCFLCHPLARPPFVLTHQARLPACLPACQPGLCTPLIKH
jgi:hypothetical protein